LNWLIWLFGIRHNSNPVLVKDVPDGIKSVLFAAWSRFNIQWTSLDIIDQKASSILAIIGVMVTVLVTLGQDTATGLSLRIKLAGVAVLVVSAILALFAYKVRAYKSPALPKKLLEYYYRPDLTNPDLQTTEMIVEHLDDIINANNQTCNKKTSLLNGAYILLVAGMILIAVAYGIKLNNPTPKSQGLPWPFLLLY
jgi:Mn2+/Fe2+ NRAMP family transporter